MVITTTGLMTTDTSAVEDECVITRRRNDVLVELSIEFFKVMQYA